MNDVDESFDDIQRLIDRAHRETVEADDVPALVWSRVRAEFATNEVEENPAMSMNPALATPVFTRPQPEVGTTRRFAGMVATIAIIGVLAFGGWFAAMNLQPGNDGNHLAMAPATPLASESCDVEPITVDEFMGLVENPYNYLSEHVQPGLLESPDRPGFIEAPLSPNSREFAFAPRTTPAERDFEQAREAADIFLNCMAYGTYGQIWALVDPVNLQAAVFTEFPVYRTEHDIRDYVESRINEQPGESSGGNAQLSEVVANSQLDGADAIWPEVGIGHVMPIIEIELIGPSLDNKVVFDIGFDAPMATYWATPAMPGPTIVMGQSTVDLRWYVLPWLQN